MGIPLTLKDLEIAKKAKKACYDKVRFKDKRDARRAAKKRGMFIYDCSFCGHMHLTSADPNKRRRSKKRRKTGNRT